MDAKELIEALNLLEKEKGISKDILLEAIENSLIAACKNNYGKADNIKVNIDRKTGKVRLHRRTKKPLVSTRMIRINDTMDIVGEDTADEKKLLFSCIVAVTQKIYLERCLEAISQEESVCDD